MSPYEIYIIYMAWGSGGKVRPVLAFIVDESTVDIYQITSQYEGKSEEIKALYFKINDWAQAGLDKQSYVDIGKIIDLPLNAIKPIPLGKLSENDLQKLLNAMK